MNYSEILRTVVGSQVHGLTIDGTDDRDEMGICIEPLEYVIGLERFEQYTCRTQPEGVRSGPGDLDLVVYSLRKWMRLALHGNPTVLLPLFAPPESTLVINPVGVALRVFAPHIVSRDAGRRFLGYLHAQRQRMLGNRGQARLPNRPELVERFGYDTKYAGHMLRLGFQGCELLNTGQITLPMLPSQREHILAVRRGQVPLAQILGEVDGIEHVLRKLIETSPLPEHPDRTAANQFLIDAYQTAWKGNS
jgi:hypothetical protein